MNARDEQLLEWVKQLPLHLGDDTVEKVEITPFNDRACQVLMFHTAMKYLEKLVLRRLQQALRSSKRS